MKKELTAAERRQLLKRVRSAGLERHGSGLPGIEPADRGRPLPLSFAQQRLWFLEQMGDLGSAYHVPLRLRLHGALDRAALRRALDGLVARHEVLRTTFRERGGEPEQRIAPQTTGLHLVEHDLSGEPEELDRVIAAEATAPFDLEQGPLVRGRLIRLGADHHVLLLTMHHIVSDGWSMGVLFRELSALYAAHREGRPPPLAELAVQYADYAVWQREQLEGEVLDRQLAYWRERLAGAPELLELPTDHPRPAVQAHRGAKIQVELSRELQERLQALGRSEGATLYMTLLGAFQVLLSKYGGGEDIVVGSPTAGRTRPEVEELIGFFVNTLVLRTDLSGDPSFREVLRRVREATLGAYRNQEVPFERLVAELQPERSLSHAPLFQVMFTLQNAEDREGALPGLKVSGVGAELASAKFDLSLELAATPQGLRGGLNYSTDLFERGTADRMLGHLVRVLEQVAADADVSLSRLALAGPDERAQVVVEWNRTESEYPRDASIHALFELQAERRPGAVAVAWGAEELTYREVDERANRLAHHLSALGVGPESRVGLRLERSVENVVATLAVLKAGGCCVPVDTSYPAERMELMLADSGARVLLSRSGLVPAETGRSLRVVCLDQVAQVLAAGPDDPPPASASAGNLAYVFYTSGSTGRPKGVMMGHCDVVQYAACLPATMPIGPGDRVAQASNASFDAAVFEIWGALLNGATLVGVDRDVLLSAPALSRALREQGITHLYQTAALFNQHVREQVDVYASLRQLVFGAEAVGTESVRRMLHSGRPGRVLHEYGPTEATVWCTLEEVREVAEDAPTVLIGRPIPNARAYVLGPAGEPLPVGVPGELCIGGAGVVRGYLGRPGLSAERFVPDPFATEPGARMYRTGDRARWKAEGKLEFMGRLDDQVKIRGFRIEPGEVEAAMVAYPGVREARVMMREDQPGEKRLVAYVVGSVEVDEMRAHLRERLPEHMVPAAYVRLEALPLTPNGKVDRKALPAPEGDAFARRAHEEPAGDTEVALAAIWSELLKVERVGRWDHFFELGGHSLLATQVTSRVRRVLGAEVALGEVFAHPVLADFAPVVERAARAELPPIERADRGGHVPLSFAQQRLWFLERFGGLGATYHIPLRLRLSGEMDRPALVRALDRLVARHEALRTTFAVVDGEPGQRMAPPEESRFHLVEHDLSGRADAEAELRRIMADEAAATFDLAAGPLIRGRLVRLAEDDHVFLATMHHVVSDAWSGGVLVRELGALYGAFRDGREDPLPALPVQYADYAVWQRRWVEGEMLERQAAYWERTLAGAPELLELPADRPRPPQPDHAGAQLPLALDEALAAGLRALSRKHGATLFMTLLAGWAATLSRLSGQDDVVIGTPTANRGRTEIEGLIGFFVNTLALRVELSGSPAVAALLGQVRERTLEAQQNQDIPFEQVVERIDPVRSLSHSPIFQVVFAWQTGEPGTPMLPGLQAGPVAASGGPGTAKFELTLSLREAGGRIVGGVEYATALFDRATVERYAGYLLRVLRGMAADDALAVDRLDLLDAGERRQVVEEWNRTEAAYPAGSCIHERFERQVERAPDAVAVSFEDGALTYAALNARANRLAHHLRALGVGPDVRVGLGVERSPEMVVGVLAVLKAGGAYVPLDPAYPEERLAYMLDDSAPAVVLTQHALRERFAGRGVPVIELDAGAAEWAGRPANDPGRESVGLRPGHLAYIIYTSGSTGQPKGAMIAHRNVARLFAATDAWFGFGAADVWTLFHSYAFDFSVWEIWGALLYGGRLVVVPRETARSPGDFYRLACREGVTVLNQTPSAFRQLMAAQEGSGEEHALRWVVFGGEALEVAALRPWFERNGDARPRLVNMYGITETTVHVTWRPLDAADAAREGPSPIGRRIPDLCTYVLDARGGPVPVGVSGELYVGGAGVARGYLGRPALTAARFVPDPFGGEPGARLYRAGDLARWRADGTLEFLGRGDHQVKIRGFRIELGEIEARLLEHESVRQAVVLAREDTPGDRRLVAYCVAAETVATESLRAHLAARLPEYMVPAAYVRLETLPLTANGKLDRRALPAPEGDAYARGEWEPPLGATEEALAELWAELLGVERVGRRDNFFELGGHSLLVVRLVERMRRRGLHAEIRVLFATPTLAELAAAVSPESLEVEVPPNRIADGCEAITAEMLPLVALGQEEIDAVVAGVPGGAANVQDIYPLTPLQEGILFHHLLAREGDPYLNSRLSAFETREGLDAYLAALQAAVDRHDILRTGMVWEGIPEPVQVVWRRAPLLVDEVELEAAAGDVARQLYRRFDPRRHRIDLRRAPLVRCCVAHDAERGGWLLLTLMHHLVTDNTSLKLLQAEIAEHLAGSSAALPEPLPFRTLVAQARLGVSRDDHEAYFRGLLGDLDEPTAPFGLLDARCDGSGIQEARLAVEPRLAERLRERARLLGVTPASVFHVAWAQVLARASGRRDVVFGTVLFGRMHGGEGADRVLGPFINTLPMRVRVDARGVEAVVRAAHQQVTELLRREHASLALAQRCSAVAAPAPLFTALLNYRHGGTAWNLRAAAPGEAWRKIREVYAEDRSSYPVGMGVNDPGTGFRLEARVPAWVGAERVCAMMHRALEGLVEALEEAPARAIGTLDVLPAAERARVLEGWNATAAEYPRGACVHQLVQAQAERTPDAVALVLDDEALSYAELNRRANRLAHHLRGRGVGPDVTVAVCVERSLEMVVGLLAVLKAGGAYVPLDPAYPGDRLRHMLEDARPAALLTEDRLRGHFAAVEIPVVALDADASAWARGPETDPAPAGLTQDHLAYVIYTSGSTGRPKGVMNLHRGLVNRLAWCQRTWGLGSGDAVLQQTSVSFDGLVRELFWPLLAGARVVLLPPAEHPDPDALVGLVRRERVTTLNLVPSLLDGLVDGGALARSPALRRVLCGGEALPGELAARVRERLPRVELHNLYGPSEAATAMAALGCAAEPGVAVVPIGRPTANVRVYVLDAEGEPVPVAVLGELYVGGAGVARGYAGRPALTAERFVPDPFTADPGARLYRTGDRARWRADGEVEFLGRTDFQVKVRGFRVEPGEVEARLAEHARVRQAVVVARVAGAGDARLVAYCVGASPVDPEELRAHLRERLPEYMVPAAYVHLDALPLTPNGKVDRGALPAPGEEAYVRREHEPPLGETEEALAEIWSELLGVERVGRRDNFFELGGHSLLVIRMIGRMRRRGLHCEVQTLFTTPVLAELAAALCGEAAEEVVVPPNAIPAGCRAITPAMLPLVELAQPQIDSIVASVPGGGANVQDIYPLAPLQEGILFHHLLTTGGDLYLVSLLANFPTLEDRDAYLDALQVVVDRHDILRTAVLWEGLPEPVQVVWRRARLAVEEVEADPAAGDVAKQLWDRFDPRRNRIDVRHAPIMRAFTARDEARGAWLLLLQRHHLISDHTTQDILLDEVRLQLQGRAHELPAPLPFRGYVAQARLGTRRAAHEAYFRELLGDVDEPTAPFGLTDAWGDGTATEEAHRTVDPALSARLREAARRLGVSVASVCHVAWAQVMARASGRDDVVFGTVLFGRMQSGDGSERILGPFINTLPVRVRLDGEGAEASVRAMHAQLAELLRHEHASLALAQRWSGVAAPAPLFTSLLNYRHILGGRPKPGSGPARRVRIVREEERTNYPVGLSVSDWGESFGLHPQVPASVGAERVSAMMHRALEELVGALESAPERAVGTLDVLPPAERALLVEEWGRAAALEPDGSFLHERFEAQAERTPGAAALVCDGETLSYAEVNARANRLAHHLRALGVGPDARVGVCVERGPAMVVGALAVLKAGGAYLPLDPDYPVERLRYMVEDGAPLALLAGSALRGLFEGVGVPLFDIDAERPAWADEPGTNPGGARLTPEHLAYVIYTSGSTGRPKGVRVAHRGLSATMAAAQRAFGFGAGDRVPSLASFAFDIWIFETLLPLLAGGAVRMVPRERVPDVPRLVEELASCTLLHAVPALMRRIVEEVRARPGGVLPSLRRAFVGGDAVAPDLLEEMRGAFPAAEVAVLYGPTEAAIICAAHRLESEPAARRMVGRPLGNAALYVLDAAGRVAPVGVAGELCLGGASVARDYLGRPGLTAERFVPDPFAAEPGARLYRTGDRVRWLAAGELEFLGRTDRQVKVRGYRIEPGEIEARIREHAGVRDAVVEAREDAPGERRLAAYYLADEPVAVDALKAHLAERLPGYMVPAAYVWMEAYPLTPNGKVDRGALPAPEGDAYARRGYEAPESATEAALAEIWSEVLGAGQVGRRDHFFEMGGHSLLGVQVASRVRRVLGAEVALGEVFANPVLADFARLLDRTARAELPPIGPADRGARIPLSFAQQRLWFLEQLDDLGSTYHIARALRMGGELDRRALVRALDRIVARHEALRTTFTVVDGEPEQRIALADESAFRLVEHDLAGRPDARAELRRVMRDEAGARFDLARGPLIRGRLVRLADDDHVLLLTMHHVVSDGWSMGVLVRELSTLYNAFRNGEPDPLPPLPVQYADYAVWQRRWVGGEALERQAAYWTRTLAGAPGLLELPTDHPRPARQTHAGDSIPVELDAELTAALRELSRRHGATLFMTLLAGWAAVLARLSGQGDVVVGTPTANRGRTEIEGLIGFFVNTLALRVELSGRPTVAELLARVRERALEVQANQDIPFEQVVERVDPVRSMSHAPLFQVMFAWQSATSSGTPVLAGLAPKRLEGESRQTALFDLFLELSEANGRIAGALQFATALFERDTAERYTGYLQRVLEQMAADDARRVEALELLPAGERGRVLGEWNRTEAEYPREACVHHLFERQAERTPDAEAVVFGGEALRYAELNARANRLAHHLRSLGVGPDVRVAICARRGHEMLVGVLAVLKAGGAYVPLDPAHPGERLRHVLEDGRPAAILTQEVMRSREPLAALFREPGVPVLALDVDAPLWADRPDTDPAHGATTAEHLAYVIYTSGSTGRPKGVMNRHGGVVNLLLSMARTVSVGADDRLLAVTTLSFDISVLELFLPLLAGARLHLVEDEASADPALLAGRVERDGITLMQATPATWRLLVDSGWRGREGLRALSGGEALPAELAARLLERVGALWNVYGPTETTIWSTAEAVTPSSLAGAGVVSIGAPVANTQAYVVDGAGQPVPAGVVGELCIGGAGAARGYRGRPGLTAERFVADPFGGVPGARLYRTGDLARWRQDGRLEFLGRTDFQVKVRGFRIELGEIEARLNEHAAVREAVVLAREDTAGDRRLVGYVVPDWGHADALLSVDGGEPDSLEGDHEADWRSAWEHAYSETAEDRGFDLGGWKSSYTGAPIPAEEMREWVDVTVSRILSLRPRRVLEIGCGTGLLLSRVAPHCEGYTGLDFSARALRNVEELREDRPDLAHVELLERAADELDDLEAGAFDTVVINSVAQYLASPAYFARVLEGAVRVVSPGGRVFVGDVRDLRLLGAFHTAVETYRSPAARSVAEWREQAEQSQLHEPELVIDPRFFLALAERLGGIGAVETLHKRGRFRNEMSEFRYDVVLHVGADGSGADPSPEPFSLDWEGGSLTLDGLRDLLARTDAGTFAIHGIPNARVSAALQQLRIRRSPGGAATVEEVRRAAVEEGVDPDALWTLGEALGFSVELRLAASGDAGRMDARFTRGAHAAARLPFPAPAELERRPLEAYASDPLRGRRARALIPRLREHLGERLPEYMVPSAYVWLEALPLTPNGKVDRRALQPPEEEAYARRAYAAPAGETEAVLAEIWSQVLGVERVGRHDDFFELGGHSLLAVQVISRVRKRLEVELTLPEMFERPVLADFARAVAGALRTELPPIVPADRGARIPLSFAQQRLWFLEQLGASGVYHIPVRLRLCGVLDRAALRRALDRIVARHEVLRTAFPAVNGHPEQRILPVEESAFLLVEHDLGGRADDRAALRGIMAEELRAPFDLAAGPLIRGRLVRLGEDDHVLLITMHHVISDAWSMGVLVRELGALYAAYRAGGEDPLPPLPVQYADYAAWQRKWVEGEVLERQAAYWTEALAGAPELLELPTDRPRPAKRDHAGARTRVSFDRELTAGLRALSQRHGATLFMTVLAGWAAVLGRLARQDDVVIGTPTANRGREEIEGLIGFFVNTLALRVDLSGRPAVAALLGQVRRRVLEAQQHQDLPFEQVVARVDPERSLSHTPLFQVMLTWQNAPRESLELEQLELGSAAAAAAAGGMAGGEADHEGTSKFDLSLGLAEADGKISGGFTYATSLFDRATAERHAGYLRRVLEQMVADDAVRVDELELLPEDERDLVVRGWNRTDAGHPAHRCVHLAFEAQAERTPDAVALVFEGDAVTYAELNRRANRLAHALIARGVGPEVRVGLCAERSPEMMVGLLGVLKAGGAYVALDPGYPAERLRYMLGDSGPAVVLTQGALRAGALRELLGEAGIPALALDDDAPSWRAEPAGNPAPGALSPEHPAYVIYTSGSTGWPKGVVVAHRSLANVIAWMQELWRLGGDDVVLQKTPYSFDASLRELVPPLLAGARLVVARPGGHQDPQYLARTIRSERVTTLHFVPTLLQLLMRESGFEGADALRRVACGGEALPPALAREFHERLPWARLFNVYGPTEAAVDVTAWGCDPPAAGDRVPLGRPMANVRCYLLDGRGRPVPIGAVGTLHIGGAQVARGYLGRPRLTAERFAPDPFGAAPGARLYDTGDLCRWRADGALEFVGRGDGQVKVRGFRIELGEIEARLLRHPAARDGAVVVREEGGRARLVAYYVSPDPVEAEALRTHFAEALPEHMVPAAFVHLAALPRTPSGKVDRRSLPAPEADAFALRGYEAPESPAEAALAEIWSEVLGVDGVGRRDHFFELGGHSLLAVQVVSRVRQVLGADVALGALFERPVLADFARTLERATRADLPPIGRADRSTRLPLSFAQQRLWFLEQLGGLGSTYHIPLRLRLRGGLDRDALARALDRLVARHEVLRTTFEVVDGEPEQRIAPAEESAFRLVEHDLADDPERESALRRLVREETAAPFDLARGPLIRGRLVRLAEDDHALLVTMHHVVSDAWSGGVLRSELGALYGAFHAGGDDPLPELPIQYADYAVWQRRWVEGEVLERQASYWTTRLSGAPHLLELPTDRPRPARPDHAGARLPVLLGEELTAALSSLSRRHGTTLFMTLLAGWAVVLSRLSGQDDVVIGTPTANRGRTEIEGLIGFFVNTLALRTELGERPTVAGVLRQVRERALEAQHNQDIPFEQVVERLEPVRSLAHTPVFQAMFTWHNAPVEELELRDLALARPGGGSAGGAQAHEGTAKFDLALALRESGGSVRGRLEYATALFDRETMERHAGYLLRVLEQMAADDGRPVDEVELLSGAERARVVEEWNRTEAGYPAGECVHELIEAQVARTPGAVAVVFEGESLTYAQLNARANRLAHHLRERGVGPDVRVAIGVERSPEMAVGLLAILKAGGAYVPIDPDYPADRIGHMLQDSRPAVLLTQSRLRDRFAAWEVPAVALDADRAAWAGRPDTNPTRAGLTPDHLAYVIYTSGSTGRPKGVMNLHRGLTNRLVWGRRLWEVRAGDVMLQQTSLSFDGLVRELFLPLLAGARVVLLPPAGHLDPATLGEAVRGGGVTTLNLVPSLLEALVEGGELERCGALRRVLCGGEALPGELAARVHERLPRVELHNLYGPSEAATAMAALGCTAEEGVAVVPIGRPTPNARVYVLDARGGPVPVGVVGELHVGGAGVGRGYAGRPGLTAERFVPDPFAARPGARLYRTGDRARWRPDGRVEFLGRTDFQVKVRGFRVEPGEIEARLAEHPQVRQAVVVRREERLGDARLVAYYVTDGAIEADALRAHLRERLPEHMVPAAYVRLEALPLNASGKLDRTALPAPEGDAYARRGYEAPDGHTEAALAEIWSRLLEVERVGRHDHFFDLGGHSLLATRLVMQLNRRMDVEIALRDVFERPVLADLAQHVLDAQLAEFDPDELARVSDLLGESPASENHLLPDSVSPSSPGGTG